jgi:hypothetical protein
MTMPERPKRRRPMLPARGTPSSTAPTDQAMLKRIRKIPKTRPDQDSKFRWYRFENFHRKITAPAVNRPKQYQVKLMI